MRQLSRRVRQRAWPVRRIAVACGIVLFLAGLLVFLWRGPWWLDGEFLSRARLQEGGAGLVTGFRATVVQVLIGAAAVTALWFTGQNYRLARRGQVTDRFIQALERLASEEVYVRYGGVLALAQIIDDDPAQGMHATQVLAAFVRQRAPRHPAMAKAEGPSPARLPGTPDEDVQAALSTLTSGAYRRHAERDTVDLQNVHLAGANLPGADLRGIRLGRSNLTGANLTGADLAGADLTGADLSDADLRGALLDDAHLIRSLLARADLTGARLRGTDLTGADLRGAVLAGADLRDAHLSAADLRATSGLDPDAYTGTHHDHATLVPEGLET